MVPRTYCNTILQNSALPRAQERRGGNPARSTILATAAYSQAPRMPTELGTAPHYQGHALSVFYLLIISSTRPNFRPVIALAYLRIRASSSSSPIQAIPCPLSFPSNSSWEHRCLMSPTLSLALGRPIRMDYAARVSYPMLITCK
jgi:hypothetical protein